MLITNALLHANRPSVWGFFKEMKPSISPWQSIPKSSLALPTKLFVCAGTLPQTRPPSVVTDSRRAPGITGKEAGNSDWRNKELKGKVLTACSVHVQAIFLRSCKFLIFYIFLNPGKADINVESCFQPTSRVLSYPPMYFVIKCFCKCVKCIIIVLPLESLRLRLDRYQEKKKKTNLIL